jgi:hypothetical protein
MTKIEWKGYGHFNNENDFMAFVNANIHIPYNTILWPTKNCPIVIWIN